MKKHKVTAPPKLSRIFQKLLFVVSLSAFFVTLCSSFFLQTHLAKRDTEALLRLNITDVRDDIASASHRNLLALTHAIADDISSLSAIEVDTLPTLCLQYDVAEINVVNPNGFITASTSEEFIGYDMREGEQASAFLVLLTGEVTELCQSYQPISYGEGISRKYAAVALPAGGFVQVGYDAIRFQRDIQNEVKGVTESRHIGESGCLILADESGIIVSDRHGNVGNSLSMTGAQTEKFPSGTLYKTALYGESAYCLYAEEEGYTVIASLPIREAHASRNLSLLVTAVMEAVIFTALFFLLYIFINRHIVRDVQHINGALAKITEGNLETVVDVRSSEEFSGLSDDINETVLTLKRYIAEAASRIDRELQFASDIQHAALPHVFPPFPNHREIDLHASMHAAKEVGGDFYDFYLLEGEKLVFLIADVSGKGIPAAMFMMSAKTLIKSYAEAGKDAAETFRLTNEALCLHNDAGMFVTAWMGILDLESGVLDYVNAGHNPPILCNAEGALHPLRSRPSFVLGGMEGIRYQKHSITLQKGEKLFLYTDGVTEAVNVQDTLYGEERLLTLLAKAQHYAPQKILEAVKTDVDAFAGDAPQFDDITMLCLWYRGKQENVLRTEVTSEAIPLLTEFAETILRDSGAPTDVIHKMNIVIDEIFSNIVKFSRATHMTLTCLMEQENAILIITDDGIPFDPLSVESADTKSSAEERDFGGLGILMVKKLMDHIQYTRSDDQNILTLMKNCQTR